MCNATRLHCSPLPCATDLFPALTAFDSIFSLHRAEIEQSTRTSAHAASLATFCRFVAHGLIVLLCARPFMLLLAAVARGGSRRSRLLAARSPRWRDSDAPPFTFAISRILRHLPVWPLRARKIPHPWLPRTHPCARPHIASVSSSQIYCSSFESCPSNSRTVISSRRRARICRALYICTVASLLSPECTARMPNSQLCLGVCLS